MKHTPLMKQTPEKQCVPTACPVHDNTAVLVVVVAVVVLPVNTVVTLVLVLLADVGIDDDVDSRHTPDPHVPDVPFTVQTVPSASIGPAKQLPSKQTPVSTHTPETQPM